MSIADHFEREEDEGFQGFMPPHEARRQFAVSLSLVILLAIAASVLGLMGHSGRATAGPPLAQTSQPAPAVKMAGLAVPADRLN